MAWRSAGMAGGSHIATLYSVAYLALVSIAQRRMAARCRIAHKTHRARISMAIKSGMAWHVAKQKQAWRNGAAIIARKAAATWRVKIWQHEKADK